MPQGGLSRESLRPADRESRPAGALEGEQRVGHRRQSIVPAAAVTIWYGEAGTAKLLILSQVVLGLALPFSVIPLVMFTADRAKMGELVAPRWVSALAGLVAVVLIVLNLKLLYDLLPG